MLNPDMPIDELLLHMGELTPSEILVARAAIRWANENLWEARTPELSKGTKTLIAYCKYLASKQEDIPADFQKIVDEAIFGLPTNRNEEEG